MTVFLLVGLIDKVWIFIWFLVCDCVFLVDLIGKVGIFIGFFVCDCLLGGFD